MKSLGRRLFYWGCLLNSTQLPKAVAFSSSSSGSVPTITSPPPPPLKIPSISPATGLPNQLYTWKEGQNIRYQCCGPTDGPPVLLVHGLFVNCDHWRKTLPALGQAGYRAYAIDLLGCGYSDKPAIGSAVAERLCGEVFRFETEIITAPTTTNGNEDNNVEKDNMKSRIRPAILKQIPLGSAQGGTVKRVVDIDLRHPVRSPYNFFTWCDLLTDFTKDVILRAAASTSTSQPQVTLVSNSIGTISSLQTVMETPDLFNGVFIISPNFRELHSAEMPFPSLTMPVIRTVQRLLRKYGQVAYDALAKPATVKRILQEPYARTEAVDDTLVQVLLDPLLQPGASAVIFDTLSYSAGPLPEQQLSMFPQDKPVWIGYGQADPWTPAKRVQALAQFSPNVERVVGWPGVGHCPHDEAPELVNPLLLEFLQRLRVASSSSPSSAANNNNRSEAERSIASTKSTITTNQA